MNFCNIFFTWIFFLESIIKIIAHGFILSPNSYLRDSLNVLDFFIVVSGISEIFIEAIFNLKLLRVLRLARPLRSIRALPTMRKLVKALINSLP